MTIDKPKFEVVPNWSDEDILIGNCGLPYMLYDRPIKLDESVNGFSMDGSFLVTRDQAVDLFIQLISALGEDGKKEEENDPLWDYDGELEGYLAVDK
jgi:hypothetical protein